MKYISKQLVITLFLINILIVNSFIWLLINLSNESYKKILIEESNIYNLNIFKLYEENIINIFVMSKGFTQIVDYTDAFRGVENISFIGIKKYDDNFIMARSGLTFNKFYDEKTVKVKNIDSSSLIDILNKKNIINLLDTYKKNTYKDPLLQKIIIDKIVLYIKGIKYTSQEKNIIPGEIFIAFSNDAINQKIINRIDQMNKLGIILSISIVILLLLSIIIIIKKSLKS